MPAITDPAAEFAALCEKLSQATRRAGSDHLADCFQVEPWSYEFYQILFCIIERANQIKVLVGSLPNASHVAPELSAHIDDLLCGFQPGSMSNRWDQSGANYVHSKNIQPIKMMSALLRSHVSYPALNQEEREELLGHVNEMLVWLEDIQLVESDFIRQAIIDGLKQFVFRLEHIEWLGWGYTVTSLKDVIGAYFALERGMPNDGSAPQAEAILKKLNSTIVWIYKKVGTAKEIYERGDFLLKAYGAVSLYATTHKAISGTLGFGGG